MELVEGESIRERGHHRGQDLGEAGGDPEHNHRLEAGCRQPSTNRLELLGQREWSEKWESLGEMGEGQSSVHQSQVSTDHPNPGQSQETPYTPQLTPGPQLSKGHFGPLAAPLFQRSALSSLTFQDHRNSQKVSVCKNILSSLHHLQCLGHSKYP